MSNNKSFCSLFISLCGLCKMTFNYYVTTKCPNPLPPQTPPFLSLTTTTIFTISTTTIFTTTLRKKSKFCDFIVLKPVVINSRKYHKNVHWIQMVLIIRDGLQIMLPMLTNWLISNLLAIRSEICRRFIIKFLKI